MSRSFQEQDAADRLRRFHLRMQISRILVNLILYLLVLLLIPAGFVRLSVGQATAVLLAAVVSAAFFYLLYTHGFDRRWNLDLSPFWLTLDAALISSLIWLDGGLVSPFFIFYLTNAAAAAFVAGMRRTIAVFMVNAAFYLGVLSAMGEIVWFERSFFHALGNVAFLFGAAYLALRGIGDLGEKRLVVKRLREEEKLKIEALTRLTHELDQQSRELATANLQIREANRLKSQFLANMSHELRTPLNSIIGFASILREMNGGEAGEKQKRFLSNIERSGEHLLSLINDLLDLSKIEAGRMEILPQPFSVREVLEGVRELMRGMSAPRGIEVEIEMADSGETLQADLSKFRQIVFNLLSNAVKFSPDHSRVQVVASGVTAEQSPLQTDSLRLEVIDQGIGIAAVDLEVIFEEFRQADDGFVRQYGGSGLGLTIVKRFVEIQGGRVEVVSQPGKGSTFTAWLPHQVLPVTLSRIPAAEPARTAAPSGEGKIVIVEDDPLAYVNLSTLLEAEGFTTVRARRGEEVFDLVRHEQPVAITLDLVLPGLDGWEVLKQLRADPATRGVPIVIVTMLENRELGLALGADDFFTKPVDAVRLVSRIRELIGPSSGAEDRRILLIDDDATLHELLAEQCAGLGLRLIAEGNGQSGIETARNVLPSLVVLDLMMPGMDGFETAVQLQNDPLTARIPIIVLTEKDITAEDRERLAGRTVGWFQKDHHSRSHFLEAIRDVVGRRGQEM
ncbi:MAG TPA: response regulator [Thermoanaerobaculia bacterium]|nr:response regulator [Thermoanaerobaculia bacterium]